MTFNLPYVILNVMPKLTQMDPALQEAALDLGCLTKLARRLKQQEDFPHEIGLFLSYPPEDVKGFLEHRPCKCVGCWKVYENEEAAKKTFAKYKACTRVYCRQLASGIDIERLTVAG